MKQARPLTIISAQSILFGIWFLFGIVIFGIFLSQTLSQKFGADAADAWGWLMPNLAPSLALITTGFLASVFASRDDHRPVAKPIIFWFAVVWSVFYLSAILVIIIAEPFLSLDLFSVYRDSSLFLGAAQSVVASLLAAFFLTSGAPDSHPVVAAE
jgi:hypothetical protein